MFSIYIGKTKKGGKRKQSPPPFQTMKNTGNMKLKNRTRNKPKDSHSLKPQIILHISKGMFILQMWKSDQQFK